MKILLVAHRGADGIGSYSAGLERALPEALAPSDELVVLGVTGDRSRRVARVLEQQLRVPLAARGADLVHLVDFRPVVADRRPFVLTVHDVCFLDRPDWFPGKVVRYKSALLRLAMAKRPAAVVCVSHYTAERLRAHLDVPADRVVVIHQAVEVPPGGPVEAPAAPTAFLTISTIEPRKNHLGLLAAFRIARAQGLRLRWRVAGAVGYDGAPIVAQLAATEGVDVLGPVSSEERERLFRESAFVAVPSLVEGFGLPVLEAMSRGVPVVAATGSGLAEASGDAALTADPEDSDAWAAGLLRLQDDTELRSTLRRRGLEHARSFDWRGTAERHVETYRSAVRRKR